ncbi:putative transporter ESBP6 [Cyphellophora attinorum]|uniref:Putative transporter ESBP6 n=1 Tax=Cyphellophora attinorum TaxID=1664694 RepID=A0A0N1P1L6_9EURO|nr:putative transporter ESBP6 [Phialophora attinorum]KPI40894.1 putative transporter ESBP6 [Phialophora attinorum]
MSAATTTIELPARTRSGILLPPSQSEHDQPFASLDFLIERPGQRFRHDGTVDDDLPVDVPTNSTSALLPPPTRRQQLMVLAASFSAVFLTIGFNQSYGVFLAYYLATGTKADGPDPFLPPSAADNKALLAFVGTLGAGLTWSGSIFVNPLMARIADPRCLTATGAGLIAGGYLMASACSQVWQLLLTQGLVYGIGSSLLYFPMLAVAPEYFDAHRGSAMGVVLSGAGLGGLTFAPLTRALLAKVGAAWTLRALGGISGVLGLAISLATPQSRSVARRPTLVNWAVARKPTFILSALAGMSQAGGNFVPLTFLPEFTVRLGYSATFGASLLAILNAVNTVSRIGFGFLADMTGRQNTLILSVLASSAVVVAFWLNAAWETSSGMWIAFVVSYGVFSGGYNSLFPTTVVDIFGTQAYASVNGFLYFVRGLGALWGSPVGGTLVEDGAETQAYVSVIWYDFALLLASSIAVILVRLFDAKDKGHFKLKA